MSQDSKPQTLESSFAATNSPIIYHGGPVILGPHNVYFIWYGNWSQNSATSILPQFISSLSGSAYFNINTTYSNSSGQSIANSVSFAGQVFDNYSQGSVLSDQGLQAAVSLPLQNGSLPVDPNGIYLVLSSADVDQKGSLGEFCINFCGFHNHAALNGTDIKFAFVGNSARCLNNCAAPNIGAGPNGNVGADGMANIMAHELNETVTDPDLNAWFDSSGLEVGDKCNFTFGPEFTSANGAPANITLGNRNFLIQESWYNAGGGFCTIGPGFSIVASPDSLLAEQFSSDTTTITVNSFNGFNGTVSLAVSGLPVGVGAQFSQPNTTSSSSLTLNAGRRAVPGTYSITVTGTSGNLLSTVPITFTVTKLNTTN
jgi:hypothetical protein